MGVVVHAHHLPEDRQRGLAVEVLEAPVDLLAAQHALGEADGVVAEDAIWLAGEPGDARDPRR